MPSVMHTTKGTPAAAASTIASAANLGGTEMNEALAPVGFDRFEHGGKDRDPLDLLTAACFGLVPATTRVP